MRYELTPRGVIALCDDQHRPRVTVTGNRIELSELLRLANLTLDTRRAAKAERDESTFTVV